MGGEGIRGGAYQGGGVCLQLVKQVRDKSVGPWYVRAHISQRGGQESLLTARGMAWVTSSSICF